MALERGADGLLVPVERRRRMRHEEALELRAHYWPQYDKARERIRESRDFISKVTRAPTPLNLKIAGADASAFRAGLPQQMTTALKLSNQMAAEKPELKRFPAREGVGSDEDDATTLEQWGEAAMKKTFADRAFVDHLLNEGEAGVKTVVKGAGWKAAPDPKDFDTWLRDEKGRTKRHPLYRTGAEPFVIDLQKTTAAYDRAYHRHLAEAFPVENHILSLRTCAPINPTFTGDGGVKIEGLIEARTFTRQELIRRRYVWTENGRLMAPGAEDVGSGEVELLTVWLEDEDEEGRKHPWVSYHVSDGTRTFETRKLDKEGRKIADAQIDLAGQFGLTSLPIIWRYGWHFAVDDVGGRSVPFSYPFIEAFMGAMSMLTGIVAHTYLTGMGGWVLLRDPRPTANPELAQITNPTPDPPPIKASAMEIVELEGHDLKPLVHGGASPAAFQAVEFMLRAIEDEKPASVGGSAPSALDRAMQLKHSAIAYYDVTDGRRTGYAEVASNTLEAACKFGTLYECPVPVLDNVELPNGKGPVEDLIVLYPEDVTGSYRFNAIYPTRPGDNLALAAQLWGFYSSPKPGITFDEWREWSFGDKNPHITRARLLVDQILDSPAGVQDVIDAAAERIADEKLRERLKLMGKEELGLDGTPEAMLAGLSPQPAMAAPGGGAGAQMAAAGTAVVDPGQMQMAGAIGGALQAARAQAAAGGVGPNGTV